MGDGAARAGINAHTINSANLEEWDDVVVDLAHPSLRGVDDVFEGLVSGCAADVFLEA